MPRVKPTKQERNKQINVFLNYIPDQSADCQRDGKCSTECATAVGS